jgi:hypothetical protein
VNTGTLPQPLRVGTTANDLHVTKAKSPSGRPRVAGGR